MSRYQGRYGRIRYSESTLLQDSLLADAIAAGTGQYSEPAQPHDAHHLLVCSQYGPACVLLTGVFSALYYEEQCARVGVHGEPLCAASH